MANRNQQSERAAEETLPVLVLGPSDDEVKGLEERDTLKETVKHLSHGHVVELDQNLVIGRIVQVLKRHHHIIAHVSHSSKESDLKFDSVEVGIGIDARGNVGIVTMGVQPSLKFTWKR
jgi:hypothetical protein